VNYIRNGFIFIEFEAGCSERLLVIVYLWLSMCACCSGFISSLSLFTQQRAGANVAGIIMIIVGVMFAALAFLDIIMLMKVCPSLTLPSSLLYLLDVMLPAGSSNIFIVASF